MSNADWLVATRLTEPVDLLMPNISAVDSHMDRGPATILSRASMVRERRFHDEDVPIAEHATKTTDQKHSSRVSDSGLTSHCKTHGRRRGPMAIRAPMTHSQVSNVAARCLRASVTDQLRWRAVANAHVGDIDLDGLGSPVHQGLSPQQRSIDPSMTL